MKERTENILNATISEFIKLGEPISSACLFRNYNFGIKPAMIRWELDELTNEGYLDQPYYSSGRIPSDRGYIFFTERILINNENQEKVSKSIYDQVQEADWSSLVQELSEELGLLGVALPTEEDRVYKGNLEFLFERMLGTAEEGIKEMIRDFDAIDERLPILSEELAEGIHVFIGTKSPITKCQDLSIIAEKIDTKDGEVMVLAIGPKRMDYEKVIKTFKGLNQINKNHGRRK
jgi:heat-inducible transcriptional repressor